LRLWQEGETAEERGELRRAEDKVRAQLWEAHKLLEVGSDEWRNSEFMRFTAWRHNRQEEIEMARGRKPARNAQADKLLTALNFVAVATKDTKQGDYQTHVRIGGNRVVAFDGVLAAGHPIEEDFTATPNLDQLMSALDTCGKQLAMTVEGATISVKGDKMKATVQCMDPSQMHIIEPQPNMYAINDSVRTALEVCMRYTREGGTRIVESSVLLFANSCVGTDGKAIVEYWHGHNLPDMVLPRVFCAAVVKAKGKLVGFGWDDGRTVTFHFDDGAWIKTQLYAEHEYPMKAKTLLNKDGLAPVEMPPDLLTACKSVAAFRDDGTVIFENECVVSHNETVQGAQFDVKNLTVSHRPRFHAGLINKVGDLIKTIDLNADPHMLLWFGDSVRGGIMAYSPGGE
jgi:hypothetical protein